MKSIFRRPRALPSVWLTIFAMVPALLGQSSSLESVSRPYRRSPLGLGDSGAVELSSDGRYALFASSAQNLTRGLGNGLIINLFLRDLQVKSNILISISADGQASGNHHSTEHSISANGRLVLFSSESDNLVASDNNGASDVFLRDWQANRTELISVSSWGEQGAGASSSPSFTPDGRFVIFESNAANLATGDDNGGGDLFLRDRTAGETWLLTRGLNGTSSAKPGLTPGSYGASISDDGRYTVYQTMASNLVAGVNNGFTHIYLHDLQAHSNILISRSSTQQGNGPSNSPLISGNGKFIAFLSMAGNLITPPGSPTTVDYLFIYDIEQQAIRRLPRLDTSSSYGEFLFTRDGSKLLYTFGPQIYLWDTTALTSTLVTKNTVGAPANSYSDTISLSDDGKLLAFVSNATDLTQDDTQGVSQVFVADLQTGDITMTNLNADGSAGGSADSLFPQISGNGAIVAFEGSDDGLIAEDGNNSEDVFVAPADGSGPVTLVSEPNADVSSSTAAGLSTAAPSAISRDGRYVVFKSNAADIVPGDENGDDDIFLRDLASEKTLLVSADKNGLPPQSGASSLQAMTPDGHFVLFTSRAQLLDLDTNTVRDVYVRDTQLGKTTLVSVNLAGTAAGEKESIGTSISADGRYVLFTSSSATLTADGISKPNDAFYRDLQSGQTVRIGTFVPQALTPDGHFAILKDSRSAGIWDLSTLQRLSPTAAFWAFSGSFSDDGKFVIEEISATPVLDLYDPVAKQITPAFATGAIQPSISPDGQFVSYLLFGRDANNAINYSLRIKQLQTGTETRVADVGNRHLQNVAAFSADSRLLTFGIVSSNLTTGDLNPLGDVFVFDRSNNQLQLVSQAGDAQPAVTSSSAPSISGDGSAIVFSSGAWNLIADDLNNNIDVLAYHRSTESLTLNITRNEQGKIFVSWDLRPGHQYQIQSSAALPGHWINFGDPISGDAARLIEISPSGLQQFFRLQLLQ